MMLAENAVSQSFTSCLLAIESSTMPAFVLQQHSRSQVHSHMLLALLT
jgi:hypothetical protein